MSKIGIQDRRVQKTQSLLRDALASLIQEKPYDAIAVTEILDRANVGRSTFYMHYSDKDELLVSAIHDMIHSVSSATPAHSEKPPEKVIRFSLPILEYHERHRREDAATTDLHSRVIIHSRLQEVLTALIVSDVKKQFQARRKSVNPISPELLAEYVASSFVLVLNWWITTRSTLSSREVDDLFRTLVLPTLTTILG